MNNKNTLPPHDQFFKAAFSQKDVAVDYISQFLPDSFTKYLNLNKLKLDNTSYVDKKLKEHFADIVYSCPYGKNGEVKISFLFEHKSTPPKVPYLQLLRYQLEIWSEQEKQKQDLTPIIPILFYHGREKWVKRPFASYFQGIDEFIEIYIPQMDYILTDLSNWTDDQILNLKAGFLVNTILLFKHSKDKEYLFEHTSRLFFKISQFVEGEGGKNFIYSILVYMLKTNELSESEIEKLINRIPEPVKDNIMNGYDVLINMGIEDGIKRGIKQGLEQGIEKGESNKAHIAVINLHKEGFSKQKIAEILVVSVDFVEAVITEPKK